MFLLDVKENQVNIKMINRKNIENKSCKKKKRLKNRKIYLRIIRAHQKILLKRDKNSIISF